MVNYILIGIIAILVGVITSLIVNKPRIIEITDIAPKEDSLKNRWLQLQNEGGKYVQVDEGKVKLKIVWKE